MRRGIVYIDENYAEFGFIAESYDNIKICFEGTVVWGSSYEALKDYLGFDYNSGYYVIGKDVNQFYYPPGRDLFPYNLDRHVYNMKFEEELFKGKQDFQSAYSFKFINELPYTFGLEFETAGGFLPQHSLYELGLIPLRDGSISGIEYTTVVLQGNIGLNLLKKQINELSKATIFDKDCSLHVHLGNFKLTTDVLLAINNLFTVSNITSYVPCLTFETQKYKTNTEKNYCEFNKKYKSFADLYLHLVDRQFYGDFKQPHPKDITGTRKWNVKSRYKAVNLINAICYNGPKTIEYRLLRPTYNFHKILGWLFIYGAYIKYAELYSNLSFRTGISLERIIRSVYSTELANILCKFLSLSERVIYAQGQVKDLFGMRVDIEDRIINYETFGHYFY